MTQLYVITYEKNGNNWKELQKAVRQKILVGHPGIIWGSFNEFHFYHEFIHRIDGACSETNTKTWGNLGMEGKQKILSINQLADHFTLFERLERALESCLRINWNPARPG